MIYIAFGEEGRKDIQKPWIIQMRRRERIPLRLRRRFCRDKTPLVFASAFIVSFVLMPPSLSSSISYHPCLSAFLAAKSISLHMVYSIHLSPRIRVPAWKEIKGRTYALNSILCLLIHFTPSSPGVSIKSRSIHCGRCRGCKKREKFCSEDWGWDLFLPILTALMKLKGEARDLRPQSIIWTCACFWIVVNHFSLRSRHTPHMYKPENYSRIVSLSMYQYSLDMIKW